MTKGLSRGEGAKGSGGSRVQLLFMGDGREMATHRAVADFKLSIRQIKTPKS
jgi:hypothetical protein